MSGDAAIASWPCSASLATSLEPMSPVPPITTTFVTMGLPCVLFLGNGLTLSDVSRTRLVGRVTPLLSALGQPCGARAWLVALERVVGHLLPAGHDDQVKCERSGNS